VSILLPFACSFLFAGYLWSFPDSLADVPSGADEERVADQFSFFSECLDERINGSLDPSPESKVFDIHLAGLLNRPGMRILAAGGYRPLLENPVFVETSDAVTGKIDQMKSTQSYPDRFSIVDVSGFCRVLASDRFSPFVFITNLDGSKIIGAKYLPALHKPKIHEDLTWVVTVPLSLCAVQGENIALRSWVYDKSKKTFCLIGRGELPVSK
jgi:hypothetical protein